MNKIRIKKMHPDAQVPEFAHATDAGCDLFSTAAVTIKPKQRAAVSTGVAMAIPEGFVGLIWDKSGRAVKDGLKTMAGVIDAGYRGEILVAVYNTSDRDVTIGAGEKVAQMLFQPVHQPKFVETETLDDTDRGVQGFGSTGLKS